MRRKIQDRDTLYTLVKKYTDFMLHRSYRRIEYVGKEEIPQNSAIIYAPNHTNALMDALVVLALDEKPKVYVARADIFKNPTIARFLYFLRIMPIMRSRDGMDEVLKNDVTIHKAADVLRDGVSFCILPEGTHRTKRSLLPLGKGIFRIALEAQELLTDEIPVQIVPLGLEYGNYFRFRSTVLVRVGDPVNVRDFVNANPGLTKPELMNMMKSDLSDRMKRLILYIPDDEWYDATLELCHLMVRKYMLRTTIKEGSILVRRQTAWRAIVEDIRKLRISRPVEAEILLKAAAEIREKRKAKGIDSHSLLSRTPVLTALSKALLFLITSVYTIPMAVFMTPIMAVSYFFCRKLKDEAFANSVRYVVVFVLWPFWMMVCGISFFLFLDWEVALALLILFAPGYHWCQDAFRNFRLLVSDIKITSDGSLRRMLKNCRRMYYRVIL